MTDRSVARRTESHSYLGDNLENVYVKMKNFSDDCGMDETISSMLVVQLESTILFPGESIALRLDKRFMSHIYQEGSYNNSIGVMIQSDDNLHGTTCEIKSRSRQGDDGEILIKGIGGRRFIVNKYLTVSSFHYNRVCIASVTVLTENYKVNSIHSYINNINPWPQWLYGKVVDPLNLSLRALELFQEIGNVTFDFNLLERFTPTEFSYFIAANLPLKNEERLSLLRADNVSLRLLRIIKLLKLSAKNLCCANCKLCIAKRDDIFTVDGDNTVGNYVNSHGIVHQTITLKKLVSNVLHTSRPSTADSWFPGTAWTIICCPRCFSHLGWYYNYVPQFTSLNRDPFFGLRRVAISLEQDDSVDGTTGTRTANVNTMIQRALQLYYNGQNDGESGHSNSDTEYPDDDGDYDEFTGDFDEVFDEDCDENDDDFEDEEVEVFSCDDGVEAVDGDDDVDDVDGVDGVDDVDVDDGVDDVDGDGGVDSDGDYSDYYGGDYNDYNLEYDSDFGNGDYDYNDGGDSDFGNGDY